MSNYAIIKDDIVIDNIVADSLDIAQLVFPGHEIIEINNSNLITVGYERLNNRWRIPQPYANWIFNNEKWEWEAPVPYPNDENNYVWNEENQNWEAA